MSYPIEVHIALCDHLNPGFGYAIEITRREKQLVFTSRAPDTGKDLQSIADCLRVVAMHVSKDELAQIGTDVMELMASTVANS